MHSTPKPKSVHSNFEEIQNILMCAKWLVHQFENMNMQSVANIFQQALNEAEIWVETMAQNGRIEYEHIEQVKEQEAKAIHNILVKYASIEDKDIRDGILNEMLRMTKESYN
jgi:uncharacterized protein YutE (UPF0331/DUF86 family)